jgi:hypothetical protein
LSPRIAHCNRIENQSTLALVHTSNAAQAPTFVRLSLTVRVLCFARFTHIRSFVAHRARALFRAIAPTFVRLQLTVRVLCFARLHPHSFVCRSCALFRAITAYAGAQGAATGAPSVPVFRQHHGHPLRVELRPGDVQDRDVRNTHPPPRPSASHCHRRPQRSALRCCVWPCS